MNPKERKTGRMALALRKKEKKTYSKSHDN
jgi:hypothetical protein